ncbi:MAG: M23 family metallopeptidase [Bacteroidota bacterium]
MRRLILIAIIQIGIGQLSGQQKFSFHPPLKIPMYLSGNFGEIRTDHIHSGIDIKTQGSIGHPVFSVEEGYISRIKVQANGYGKSVYVNHPSGHTSVYGHLDRYKDDIAAYVKKIQYARKSHTVDLYLDAETFPLKKGELIAYSGNTGGSSGPHLHFEIRKATNQHPTNVLQYGFDIHDRVAPRFHSLFIYTLKDQSLINGSDEKFSSPVVKDNGVYTIPWGTGIQASGTLGISVEVFDYLNGASNRCGVYSLELYLDDRLHYRHVMNEFSFNETRYINAHIDFEEHIRHGVKAHRLHRLPNDRLRIYEHLEDNGELRIDEKRSYQVRILARDVAGNKSELSFNISGDPYREMSGSPDAGGKHIMKYNEANSFEKDPVSIRIPKNALYQDMDFTYAVLPQEQGSLTSFYRIGSEEVPVHTPYSLSILSEGVDPALRNKLLIVTLDEEGKIADAGGEYKGGKVSSSQRSFGKFAIAIDTIPPEIKALGRNPLKFLITDELSGIDKYDGYIDNQWVLFEYDMKNDLLFHEFDKDKITSNTAHELELYVSDSKGNTSLYRASFTW